MSAIAVVAAAVVGAAFVLAGAAKLVAGVGWNLMRVPAWLAAPVPYVELAIGSLLVVRVWHPWPARAAAALLVAFTVVIARELAAGKHPPCACFGAWSAKPLGWRHVVRNGVLLALTGVALAA